MVKHAAGLVRGRTTTPTALRASRLCGGMNLAPGLNQAPAGALQALAAGRRLSETPQHFRLRHRSAAFRRPKPWLAQPKRPRPGPVRTPASRAAFGMRQPAAALGLRPCAP